MLKAFMAEIYSGGRGFHQTHVRAVIEWSAMMKLARNRPSGLPFCWRGGGIRAGKFPAPLLGSPGLV